MSDGAEVVRLHFFGRGALLVNGDSLFPSSLRGGLVVE
jgi:hypothetical protein